MRNALVTGAAGFIGLKLVEALFNRGYKVSALIEKNDIKSINKLKEISASIIIYDDFQKLINSAELFPKYDCIFHLATVGVIPGFNNISAICDVNIKMGCQLVDFTKKSSSKLFVNFGSCFEYGDHGGVLLKEDMNCLPESLYAISKNASTNLVTAYAKSENVNMITVRPFGVFGEGEGINRLAPSIISHCLNGEIIETTFGEQIRDFVNVKDLVKAIIILSESEYKAFEIYNICSNNPVSVKNFISEIVDVCGFDSGLIKFGALPYRENESMTFAGDNTKLQKVINYPFPNNHRDGILDIYNSIKHEQC